MGLIPERGSRSLSLACMFRTASQQGLSSNPSSPGQTWRIVSPLTSTALSREFWPPWSVTVRVRGKEGQCGPIKRLQALTPPQLCPFGQPSCLTSLIHPLPDSVPPTSLSLHFCTACSMTGLGRAPGPNPGVSQGHISLQPLLIQSTMSHLLSLLQGMHLHLPLLFFL